MQANAEKEKIEVNVADLALQYRGIEAEINEAVLGVLGGGQYVLGKRVRQLEEELAAYCGAEHALGLNSGTDALLLALMALGVGPGDEVVMPAFTIIVDAAAACLLGARPVFADVDPHTFNLDPEQLEAKITPRTKAVIAVHLYGQTADMDAIKEVAGRHNVPVVEDACQAIGAEYKGRRAGSLGDVGCFSFYPTKNLGTYGDGGLVTTNDRALAEKLRLLRAHGDAGQYDHVVIGINSRLDELHAAVLSVKLKHLDGWTEARRRNAARYTAGLAGVPGLTTPHVAGYAGHVFHQYTVRTAERDGLRAFLKERGVASAVYYPIPLHLQRALRHLGHSEGDFPESERAAREALSIPVYAELEPARLDYVVECVREFFGARAGAPHA